MNIKEKISRSGLYQWEIAEKINVSEFTFSRWMRRPENLSQEKLNDINKAIEELKIERKVI
jgi:DNA-binding LacI/PurR family transcriptional regulator